MLTPIIKRYSKIHIAGKEYRVRYSFNSLLCLEMSYKPLDEIIKYNALDWTVEDILQLTRAALVDLPQNRKATTRQKWDSIKPDVWRADIQVQDLRLLKAELLNAISDSLPQQVIGQKASGNGIDGLKMRAIYVDVLHRPEREFWTATLREVSERIESYFDVKGYGDNVIHAEEFDTEGM